MSDTGTSRHRRFTSAQLLITAGAAFAVMVLAIRAYPNMVAAGADDALVVAVRILVWVCLAAVVLLPIAAIVRRLVRRD